jgi:tripartite ATP-independent transporter DctM subunit
LTAPPPAGPPAAAAPGAAAARPSGGPLARLEDGAVTAALALLALLPAANVVMRLLFGGGLAVTTEYVRHLTLWVALLAGVVTTRQGAHLALSSGLHRLPGAWGGRLRAAAGALSVAVTTALAASALSLVLLAFDPLQRVGGVPIRAAVAILPLGFAAMAARFVAIAWRGRSGRVAALLAIPAGLLIGSAPLVNALQVLAPAYFPSYTLVQTVAAVAAAMRLPLVLALVAAAFIGTPIFVLLSGFTLLQFLATGGALEVVPDEVYSMLSQPLVPALPLFTFAGFLLSESKAGERLIRVFQAWFSWFRGGLAVMAVLLCAFFTTFTGASGVTILALGGLLLFMLVENGYRDRFAVGLLTASGSIGLLFPPALPIIMYGVIAQIDIRQLFVGGFLPGLVMVLALAGYGIYHGARRRAGGARPAAARRFSLRQALLAARGAVWELALPVVVVLLYFGGITTLVETAAAAAIYVLLVEMIVHRDIALRSLPRVLARCTPIVGGVMVILALAKGLSYFMVDAEVPTRLVEWVSGGISSRLLFLILLNLTLLVAGALMDIFSAIVVLGPLLIPLGMSYGVHPVHLGIIFLANLELGYLTPPVGINLFLASYRFDRDLVHIYRTVVPFLIVLVAVVLVITYVPLLTTGLLSVIRF